MTLVMARTRLGSTVWHALPWDEEEPSEERELTLCGNLIIGYQDSVTMRKRETFCRSCINLMHGLALKEIKDEEEFYERMFIPGAMDSLEKELDELEKTNPQIRVAREALDEAAKKLFEEVHRANNPIREYAEGKDPE